MDICANTTTSATADFSMFDTISLGGYHSSEGPYTVRVGLNVASVFYDQIDADETYHNYKIVRAGNVSTWYMRDDRQATRVVG